MISIIVPVYNASYFLDKCVTSILEQSYTDFELLLIDDGSTDVSGKICDDYSRKDKRVKTIHKENGGVSSARNIGLSLAKGEWITFVDSDDWVHKDFLKSRYEKAIENKADISYCDVCLVYETTSEYCSVTEMNDKCNDSIISWLVSRTTYSGTLLIKKDILDNIRYLEGIRFGEDFNMVIKVISNANKIVHVKEALYFYNRINESSTMHNLHTCRDDLQIVYTDLIADFKQRGLYNKYIKYISWSILEYKLVSILNREHTYKELETFSPESNNYIWSNKFISFKSKFFLFCYKCHFDWLAKVQLKLYSLK